MKDLIPGLIAYALLLAAPALLAQTDYRVHSHNDYLQEVPFWYAYSSGASSIEVDVWLREGELFVAHDREEIAAGRTFDQLYLGELDRLAAAGTLRPVQLLIDLKSEAYATLDRVVAAINQYPRLADGSQVTFVVSGNRPQPGDYANYPAFIRFDHQDLGDLQELNLDKVALISQSFRTYSVWNGLGRMTATDLGRVDSVIQRARATGKPFRFWATPDTKTAWTTFARLGIDFINTDDPAAAHAFLSRLDHNSFRAEGPTEVYVPEGRFGAGEAPKNVILLIGDGNGLAQISAARMANGGELSLTNITTIGLVGTASADDPVTDSAAGGTAMATGTKTNNRAIGVDPAGLPVPTLVEILSEKGYRTGIITTDAIHGATPSSFYAHTDERDDAEKIMRDLARSNLSFFVAGGTAVGGNLGERRVTASLDQVENLDEPVAVYNGDSKMPSVLNGRGTYLPESVGMALSLLDKESKPFFLVVEGAQIDNGGHTNDVETVITEGLDFDRTVGEALRFADANGETLVIVTADHETGGLGVAGGAEAGEVRADFLSTDHSGILVPLFAYGPGAAAFGGVFENNEIYFKILGALGVEGRR